MPLAKAIAEQEDEPDVFIGTHCRKPYPCPFESYCWPKDEAVTVYDIARLGKREEPLRSNQVVHLAHIPEEIEFTPKQSEFIAIHLEKRVEIDHDEIRRDLSKLRYPLHFLDFETINHAVPAYTGCTPYQQVTFQYSCHLLYEDGRLEHAEYLHPDTSDPRPSLIHHLLNHIQPMGDIVVYSNFESSRVKELARDFPQYSDQLDALQNRFWDLLNIFKKHYKDYRFGGSNSIKRVLPVLVPSLTYDNLAVQNGEAAQIIWEQYIHSEDGQQETLRHDLLEYCKLDTLAMVRIYKQLEKAVTNK